MHYQTTDMLPYQLKFGTAGFWSLNYTTVRLRYNRDVESFNLKSPGPERQYSLARNKPRIWSPSKLHIFSVFTPVGPRSGLVIQ